MYEFNLPILEWKKQQMSKCRHCPKCGIALMHGDPQEISYYFIGDVQLTITSYVPKASCSRCGYEWEDHEARIIRNEDFRKKIDEFWLGAFKGAASPELLSMIKSSIKQTLEHAGGTKKRRIAEELIYWLADLSF